MYVVRRTFRNFGQMMAPGSIVEPGAVKRFKSRLADGHIVEVSEQDFDKWAEYFKVRFGVDIHATGGVVDSPVDLTGEPEQTEEPEQTVQVAKVVVAVK